MTNETSLMIEIFSKAGIAGILMVAVWYVARRLADSYESRIKALEAASLRCEEDRVTLRNQILSLQNGIIEKLSTHE